MALAGFLLLTGACNDDDGGDGGSSSSTGGDAESYVKETAKTLREGEGPEGIKEPGATCIATALVDVADASKLKDAEVTPQEFADADDLSSLDIEIADTAAADLSAQLTDCDMAQVFETGLVDAFTSDTDSELTSGAATCLTDALDDDEVVSALAEIFVDGDSPAFEQLFGPAFSECPDAMTEILVASAGPDLSPEAKDCLATFVATDPATLADRFVSGDEQLGEELATACPEAFGGG